MNRMAVTPRGRIEKLPKWAQDHIRVLNMRLEEAYGALDDLQKGGNTVAQPYSESGRMELGDDIQVRWEFNDRDYLIVRPTRTDRESTKRPGEFDLQASDNILVIPQASNHVLVRVER